MRLTKKKIFLTIYWTAFIALITYILYIKYDKFNFCGDYKNQPSDFDM